MVKSASNRLLRRLRKKGQLFSLDMVISFLIFISLLLSGAWLWDQQRETITLRELHYDLAFQANNALASLVETPGNPQNWSALDPAVVNSSTVLSLGLAPSPSFHDLPNKPGRVMAGTLGGSWVIDPAKLESLTTINSSTTKKILGILGPNYDYFLQIKVWNGTTYTENTTLGTVPESTATEVVMVDRFALLNNNWAQLTMTLWKGCEGVVCP